jgi:hypothetical protein
MARAMFGGLLTSALLAALWYSRHSEQPSSPAVAPAAAPASAAGTTLPGGVSVQAGAPPEAPAGGDSAALRRERLRLAEERLATYRAFVKYPPGSRPARENPDQLRPRDPVVRGLPLSLGGQPSQHVGLKLRQDKMAVIGGDTITLGIRCEDTLGHALPCAVQSATLSALPGDNGPPPGQRAVSFAGSQTPGQEGEQVATFRPLDLKIVDKAWPLRVDVTLRAGDDPSEQGSALFDFMYTPDPPAIPTGRVREAMVDGSLVLYYTLDVRRAGRYVLHTRVDDERGQPVAFLEWNDLLPVGVKEVPMTVFGKLVLDEKPAMPLKARDFDGFLLKEQVDPDREHIPPLGGYHYTTQSYSLRVFSPREYESEERTRMEQEYERDVDRARQ